MFARAGPTATVRVVLQKAAQIATLEKKATKMEGVKRELAELKTLVHTLTRTR